MVVNPRNATERLYYYREPPDELRLERRMAIAAQWAVERGLLKSRAVTPVMFAVTPGWPNSEEARTYTPHAPYLFFFFFEQVNYGAVVQQTNWPPYYAHVAAPLLVAFAHAKPKGTVPASRSAIMSDISAPQLLYCPWALQLFTSPACWTASTVNQPRKLSRKL